MPKNKFKNCIILVTALIIFLFTSGSVPYEFKLPETKRPPMAYEEAKLGFLQGQVIVRFKDGYDETSLRKSSSFNYQEKQRIPFGFTKLFIDGDVKQACKELMNDPAIDVAEPNYIRYAQVIPNDPLFSQQNNLKLSRAELGWNIETGDADVIVAVIDTGVDKQHPDLIANLIPGKDIMDGDDDEKDDSGHGTSVSGVIGASGNNGIGVAGSAWHIKILPLRACGGPSLWCPMDKECEAIEEAILQGADIINLSLGGFNPATMEEEAINGAWDAGIVIFAAAGNDGLLGKFGNPENEGNINYPAGYEHVCGVASVDYPVNGDISKVVRSVFSNYGDAVSVTAVGRDVVTTAPSVEVQYPIYSEQADYGRIDGTSFSTPLVSGLAALIKSHFPNLSNSEIRAKIETSARDIGAPGWDDEFGFGIIDFQAALIGSIHAVNDAFNVGITSNPIMTDDVIIVVKVKLPIDGNPQLSYSYNEEGNVKTGTINMIRVPNQNNIWATRFHTLFSGKITFSVKGTTPGGGDLPELLVDYSKGKSD